VRGLAKNLSYETLKIQLKLSFGDSFHLDNGLDLCSFKAREHFVKAATVETKLRPDILKRDLGRLLLALEDLQEETIRRAIEPQNVAVEIDSEDQQAALELLQTPDLLDRLLGDFNTCGVVGEDTNKLVGYLAATSRKFDRPLGIIVQSTSAAGKTTLMESILAFMPEEERVKYSAMTGQALFYLGETNIKHKILAIAEEEGAERATYALKLLQSEGELTIASTGKDATTGRMQTEEYHVEGPAMIFFTTTNIEIDEELQNRCLTLTVDESREQTRRIHQLQREEETIEGHLARKRKKDLIHLHRNAQRLLKPVPVHNPFARQLTFPDENTRLRRDQVKYLTLIRTIAFLHQHQRPRVKIDGVEYIEVIAADIAKANEISGEVLGRSLDELPPQTRRFLNLLWKHVEATAKAKDIQPEQARFGQREAREKTNWSHMQVKRHMAKLVEFEYLIAHSGGRGQSWSYELVYRGEGSDGQRFLPGLIDATKLNKACAASHCDEKRGTENTERGMSGAPEGHARGGGGSPPEKPLQPSTDNALNDSASKTSARKEVAHA